jgi:serine/threonine-protein kinase
VLLRAGETIADRYRVRRVLAIGGMGVVYQVVSLEDGTPLAMKTILPDLAGDELLRRRFEREARAMQVLAHPGIVAIVDTVTDRGAQYLLMQLVSGLTLDKVQAGRPLDARRAFLFARQTLDALEHAHGHGVVHRDLKPQNLLVTKETAPRAVVERIKVLDFGIAKILHAAGASQSFRLTESGCTHGTPAYIAPEQARRDTDLDHRVDLYALGVMLFEMLTGVRPFDGPDDITIMRKHLQEPPPFLGDVAPLAPFTIPVVELVVATALAKDPDRRYRSAAAMRDALDEAFATLDARGLLSRPG